MVAMSRLDMSYNQLLLTGVILTGAMLTWLVGYCGHVWGFNNSWVMC